MQVGFDPPPCCSSNLLKRVRSGDVALRGVGRWGHLELGRRTKHSVACDVLSPSHSSLRQPGGRVCTHKFRVTPFRLSRQSLPCPTQDSRIDRRTCFQVWSKFFPSLTCSAVRFAWLRDKKCYCEHWSICRRILGILSGGQMTCGNGSTGPQSDCCFLVLLALTSLFVAPYRLIM